MTKGKEAGRIQVYVRVRPFTEKEREKKEINAIALHHDHSLIRVLDPRRDTNYFFDGVFGPESSNYELYLKVGRPLVYAALNGYKGTLLTYGQTGTGKTYTLLSDDGVTTNVVNHCFERIQDDTIHSYKVTCSFLQVYQEKVYDLLNPRFTVELPVREHPKKGVYVANLTQNEVKCAEDVLSLLEFGKRQLVMAETKMVRHSSRSHSIMQLIIERRLKAHIAMEQASTEELGPKSPETVHDSIMAVDETINNLLKELKQDRKAHHRRERECLRELMEKELEDSHSFKGDVIVKGKINLCDLAGSERLTKTKAEGVRLTEAKYLNTSLLELGNVIHALARGKKRHVPYRNSTLTRLLQDCLGDNGKTNFIVDYKVLAERLAKKLEDQDRRHKLEKLEYLREIQRLNSAVTSYEESEHVVNSDTDTLVSVIQNLSKTVQREKEEVKSLQTELTCLKRKVAHSPTANAPDIEALFLAELMSMQLLIHVNQSEAVYEAVRNSDLPNKVKEYMTSECTQQNMVMNTGYMLNLLDTALGFGQDNGVQRQETDLKDCEPKKDQTAQQDKGQSVCKKTSTSYVSNMTGGLRKMLGLFVGNKETGKTEIKNDEPEEKQPAHNNTTKDHHILSTSEMLSRMAKTKEKVEKHVSNLLLSAFGEQLIFSQGNAPQWGVLGRKLSELIMFKRNNIIGVQDTEMWSNYENVVGILESCFKYVMIDKALLASMIVIEHMSNRGSHYPRLPSPGRALKFKAAQETVKALQQEVTAVEETMKSSQEIKDIHDRSNFSPTKTPKGGPKVHLEQEINEVFDDTSRLETELFATMEEKARLEDELILMKDYVNRLKSDMFHLKIERTNLEKEVKKTAKNIASLSESQQDDHVNIMDGYRGLRVGELSDVTEASHEDISGESENGSHVSEGNDQSSQILKSCLASMAQMYTLMPNQDDDTLTEGGESDEKDASLSENDIDDSEDDDIIITKIARGIQDYHSPVSSPTKSKKSDGMSRKSGGATSKVDNASKGAKRVIGNKDIVQAQRAHKTYQDLQVAYEDLEDELYHVRGQLSKAQQIILSLEAKLKEEKENWEKIRKLYLEYKDKNDVLEGKVGILREELEKALRENTFLKDYHQVDVVKDGQNKLYGHHSRSPTRSPSKRKVFDLRNIPSIQNSNRETQIINLLEENTELKTLNDKLAEEKVLAENLSKEKDCKLKGLETTIRFLEEEKETLKEEIETIHRRKFKVRHEGQEKQETSYSDLDVFTKECAQLEKELTLERSRAAKLQNENQNMSKDLEKMKEELKTWKNGAFKNEVIQDEDLTPTNEKSDKEKWSGNRNNAFQTVFIDDDFGSEEESKMKDHGIDSSISTADELKDLTMKLQREMISMSEYQEALEKEYGETKEETEKLKKNLQNKETMIKSLEIEISTLKRQNVAKQTGENHGTFFSRLNLKASPSKLQTTKDEFDFSKKDEMTYQDVKKYEEELNTLKKENSDLRQQITKSEQKIVIYEGDLEKAMLKIKQLQEDRLRRGIKGEVSDSDNKPTAADAEHYLAASDAKLSKTTREIERLKEQLLDKEAEKGLLYDELHLIRRRKDELDKALDEAREARTELQEKMDQMAKCTHFEDSVKELTEKNKKLVAKLQQSEETIKALTKKNEKQSEKLKSMEDDLVSTSGEKLKGDFELRNVVLEMEKAKSELQHSEQESKLLSAELNDKLEWATNLEIQLLELKCSNECMKSEIEEMKEKKRMESHQNICRETMEKRLNEAFKTNNQLQKEVQSTKDENNVMNEKLRLATERKQEVEGEVEKLKAKLGELSLEIENSSFEKKQYETKTKKLEDSRKKMDEELKRLKENIGSLQNDLQRIEKDHDDSLKKSNSLEKELRRKTKELDNKLRENRKLKKDISAMKERTATNAEGEHDGSAEIKDLKERMEELEKENEDLYARLDNIKHHDKQDGKSKHVTFASSVLSEEVGWDFDNETLSQEHDDSADLSDEVGWDLSDVLPKQKDNDSESLTVEVESKEHSDKVQEKEILDENQTEPKEPEPQDEREAIAQLCKEKLLLESSTAKLLDNHTSYLTKNQLNLECSLSKALKENKQLVNRLNDSQIILQRIKARVQKLEEQTSVEIITTHAQMQTDSTESVSIGTQSDVKSINVQISPNTEEKVKELSEEVESPTKTGVSAKAIVYLTREKKQIAKELENLKQKHEEISRMLAEKEESKTKLEQELKLITTAYEQEKESLLHDLEVLKKENITIKQDIQSQTDLRTKCDEFNQKHQEAERLVVELEKDLMRQMEEKTKLNKELIESRSKLTEMSLIEQELHRLRNENRQVEESMGEQLEKYRKENEELLQTLEKRKKPWVSTSPKKVPQVKKRDRVANANNKAQSESQNEDPSSQSAKEIEDKSHSESLEFCDNSIERADSFFDGDAYGGQEKVESVLDEHCGNSFDLSDEKATSEEDHDDNNKNQQQLTFQKNVEQEDQGRNRGEQANSDSNESMTELLEPIDALKERSTMKEDTASEAGFDTDEEAGIEEKLVKILKERQVMELEVQAMVQEMNKLKTKLTKMQSEHEQNNAEQENIKLKTQLDEYLKEKKELDEEVKKIKDRNTQLEIELSEAIEAKTSMEKQLNKLKESGEQDSESETRNDKEVLEFKIKNSELEKQLSEVTVIKHDLEEELKMFRESSTNEAKTMKIDNEDVESQDTQMDIELLIALETQKTLKDEIESLRKSNEQESLSKKEKMDEIKTKNAELEKKLVEVTETKNALENDLKTLKEFNEKKTQSEIEKNEAFEAIKNRNTQLENKLAEFTERNETLENKLKTVKDCAESNQEDERVHEVKARCKKLEEVLSEVVDENSNLLKEVSSLKEQNRMLKTRNIFEISDSSTQVSPMAFESSAQAPQKSFETEECNDKHQTEIKSKNRNNETPIINVSSQEVNESPSGFSTMSGDPGKDHLKLPLESSLKRYPQQNTLSVESKPLSASSPDISSAAAEEKLLRAKNDKQVFSSTAELTLVTPESESGYGGSKGGNTCIRCRKSTCECDSQRKESPEYKNSNDLMSTESVYGSTSADVYIDSSFASATDFDDMSFSSDWVSAEDLRAGRVTARGHHGMNKMHRELAEMKCTNTILENELTILKHRNTDYQSQLQKLAGKNNSLKQKLCERSMLTKKAEREIEALTEDKMRLEVQITSEKEEVNRLEREKSKFERNLTSAKAENKRLKIDLGMVKAENYKNMKHLVKLEGENKKLLSELEETQEELKNTKELLVHFENGSLTSLDDRLSCTSPISTEGMAFSNTGTSVRRDRAGLSLELKSNSHVRRVTSEQSFPRYHGMAKELTTSSESDVLTSPEDYNGQQQNTYKQRQAHERTLDPEISDSQGKSLQQSRTQSEQARVNPEQFRSQSERAQSQMSYDSDMSFGERDVESCSQSEETEDSVDLEGKGKNQQVSIKKMFKRFSKSKKISKSSSS